MDVWLACFDCGGCFRATCLYASTLTCGCQGANVHAVCKPNNTPVMSVAAEFGNQDGCKLLLEVMCGFQDATSR